MTGSTIPGDALSMVLVMGVTGSGKSYFINATAGKKIVKEGEGLGSCTGECALVPVEIGPNKVLVIDTPGFDDTKRSNADILDEIARILAVQYKLGVELKGVIYMHRITDNRYAGSAIKTFEIFKKICGLEALKNVLLVTSRWEGVDDILGSLRERELREKFWSYMLMRGSNMGRFHGTSESAISLVSQLLIKDTIVLDLQRELVDEGKLLNQTTAGSYVNDDIEELKQQYQQNLDDLEKLKDELRATDRQMKLKVQQDLADEKARLQRAYEQQVSLHRPIAQEVDQEINRRKGLWSRILPFVPSAISLLSMFVHMPSSVMTTLSSWLSEWNLDPSDLFGSLSG